MEIGAVTVTMVVTVESHPFGVTKIIGYDPAEATVDPSGNVSISPEQISTETEVLIGFKMVRFSVMIESHPATEPPVIVYEGVLVEDA